MPMAVKQGVLLALMLLLISTQVAHPGPASTPDVTARGAEQAIAEAEAVGERTFVQMGDAEREGGNVTDLAARFNGALNLIDGARAFADEGLYGQAIASADNASELFSAIGRDAQALGLQAAAESSNARIEVLLVSPIAVILITLIAYYAIRLWRRRQIGRTLEMGIEEVKGA
jgi:hypothetical protein